MTSATAYPTSIPNNVLVSLPTILNFALELVYVGREEAQRVALEAVRAVIAFLPAPGHSQDAESSVDVISQLQSNQVNLDDSIGSIGSVSLVMSPPAKAALLAASTPDRDSAANSSNGTPVPVGSAVNAAHARKAASALERVLREVSEISKWMIGHWVVNYIALVLFCITHSVISTITQPSY